MRTSQKPDHAPEQDTADAELIGDYPRPTQGVIIIVIVAATIVALVRIFA